MQLQRKLWSGLYLTTRRWNLSKNSAVTWIEKKKEEPFEQPIAGEACVLGFQLNYKVSRLAVDFNFIASGT